MTQEKLVSNSKIWSAWIQGRKNAPGSVRIIFDLWEDLNQDSEFRVLEGDEICDLISDLNIDPSHLTPQVKTNIARTFLLSKFGGTWVDSTLLPTVPLSAWLWPNLTKAGFFAFRSTGHRSLILQNWFLYSDKSCILTERWLNFYCEYFERRRYQYPSKRALLRLGALDALRAFFAVRNKDYLYFVDPLRGRNCCVYPYALHNYTLAYLLGCDEEVKRVWSAVPMYFNVQPGLIGACAADRDTPSDVFEAVGLSLLPHSPVHKLNHRDPRFEPLILSALEKKIIDRPITNSYDKFEAARFPIFSDDLDLTV